MREIKFRAWDKDNGNMYYSDKEEDNGEKPIWWEINKDGIKFGEMEFDQWYDPDDKQMHEHVPNQILMQYTGLKDKSGVEIYEGDIIKLNWETIKMEGYVKQQDNGEWIFYKDKGNFLGIHHNKDKIEVIGNIYEGEK